VQASATASDQAGLVIEQAPVDPLAGPPVFYGDSQLRQRNVTGSIGLTKGVPSSPARAHSFFNR